MRLLAISVLVIACAKAPQYVPNTNTINGRTHYTIDAPVRDDTLDVGLTKLDKAVIVATETCPDGFQETQIKYGALSPDGLGNKSITYYCL